MDGVVTKEETRTDRRRRHRRAGIGGGGEVLIINRSARASFLLDFTHTHQRDPPTRNPSTKDRARPPPRERPRAQRTHARTTWTVFDGERQRSVVVLSFRVVRSLALSSPAVAAPARQALRDSRHPPGYPASGREVGARERERESGGGVSESTRVERGSHLSLNRPPPLSLLARNTHTRKRTHTHKQTPERSSHSARAHRKSKRAQRRTPSISRALLFGEKQQKK